MVDDKFLDDIGLAGASDEQKAELIDQLSQTVLNRVAARLEEVLSEDELEQFDAASEQGDEAAFNFLNKVYPDYPILVQEEMEQLKSELSQDTAAIKQALENDKQS